MKDVVAIGKLPNTQVVENTSSKHFVILSTPEAFVLVEGELHQLEGQADVPEFNSGPWNKS